MKVALKIAGIKGDANLKFYQSLNEDQKAEVDGIALKILTVIHEPAKSEDKSTKQSSEKLSLLSIGLQMFPK